MNRFLLNTVHEYPIQIIAGDGSYLMDGWGKKYLDFWGDEGVNSLGYNNPIIKEVLESVEINHVPKMYGCPYREALAEKLVKFADMGDAQVIFSNSGTEANEAGIKLSRVHWYKKNLPYKWNVATMFGNFHGRTGFSLAASDSSDSPYHKLGFGPMPVGFYKFKNLYELKGLIDLPGGLSSVTMATILGNNCIETYPQEFFIKLCQARDEHNFHIILDEVQVGMGRTGRNMAFHHYNFTPDVVTLGKGIAAGFPLSATIVSKEIADTFEPGMHFNTFGGNIVSTVIALKVIEYVENNLDGINEKGQLMYDSLSDNKQIQYVTGKGMHLAFQVDFDQFPADVDGFSICKRAMELGLLIVTHRKYGEIRFTPPISISIDDLRIALSIMHRTLEQEMNSTGK